MTHLLGKGTSNSKYLIWKFINIILKQYSKIRECKSILFSSRIIIHTDILSCWPKNGKSHWIAFPLGKISKVYLNNVVVGRGSYCTIHVFLSKVEIVELKGVWMMAQWRALVLMRNQNSDTFSDYFLFCLFWEV